eukprot:TRINITY_DN18077_c0_g1_i2.p2 TRINITY_DN18077_c0_g1~~TRINITY_DN18077_c0_g1_i2.p2  ORF type:complete len:132 (-),score=33.63 TRINITY_DN18077_c0_g1_i2:100-495(-)
MRHLRDFRKLGRTSSHRWAMLRNQVTQLVKHDAITTTVPKAKELRRVAEKVITLAKKNNLHSFRQANAVLTEPAMVRKLFATMPERFGDRSGGYTRILKLNNNRFGDNAPMARIEFLSETVQDLEAESEEA